MTSLLFYQNQNMTDLKRINDSMSEKIKQNKKQKTLFNNNIGSNITSGINTEKRNNQIDPRNNYNNNIDELNMNNSLGKNASQSSLSVDLNRFKINPNNFNNYKIKQKLNQNENFETFDLRKENISVNNSNENIDINDINNDNNIKKEKNKNYMNSLLKSFNPCFC